MTKFEGGDFRNYLVRNGSIIPQFEAISIGQYKFSIQASEFAYSSPRENRDPYAYTEFELGYCGQLYNQYHNNIIDNHNIDDSIVAYVDYIKVQQMLDWHHSMMTKEEYLRYVVRIERELSPGTDKTYDCVKDYVLTHPNYSLDKICDKFIYRNNEDRYRRDLKDYLHLTYSDLLDETNLRYQDILDAL